ncbi:sorbitol dehydrogenase-like [Mercenaria mercenaria]|uniref:sorbitol dehydrogenase-like n=1 Tax=Mercenaria mercenaria TaxID=6596 RepID=UPI001E1D5EFF|nr:sorbitol dehydrogenase-like [Mercenaria mercenaria]
MTDKNLSAVLHGKEDLQLKDMAIPEPGPGEVQVRMQHVGICGTDLHLYQTGMLGSKSVKEPMPIGHESAGVISKLGEGVSSVKVGDRVALEPVFGCMACQVCKKGDYNLCKDVKVCGVPPKWGSMTRYFIHRAADCYKLPDHVNTEEGALMEPLTIAIHSCRRAGVCLGSKVLVLGDGPISIMVVLAAKASGATKICVTGKHDNRLNVAKQVGAHFCVNVASKEPKEAADMVTNALGEMYDCSIDCIGAEISIHTAFLATRSGGNVVLAGLRQNTITIPILAAVGREVDIRGVMVNAHCYPIALDMVASGQVNIKPLVSHVFPLEKVNEAFEKAATKDCMKVMIKCSKD